MSKIIVRLKGGLGNQLFTYCAARRLAYVNNAELVLDSVTGFVDDYVYRNKYALDHFQINARIASSRERIEPFSKYRRKLIKLLSRASQFNNRKYIEEINNKFDSRLIDLRIKRDIYFEGYWQDERYFIDIEDIIRKELQINPPDDEINRDIADQIIRSNSIAIHVRWFDNPKMAQQSNVPFDYYLRAINKIEDTVKSPHYFLFSDFPHEASKKFNFLNKLTVISNNKNNENVYKDLWLMSQCKHFIIANSTFSWWGAWLAQNKSKIIIAPDICSNPNKNCKFYTSIPERWLKLSV